MLKRISSSPVFFYSPPTSFTNNVLCIDRSPYYPKTTLEFFFITFRLLKVTRLGLSPAYHATHFLILSRFQLSYIEKKITRMTINTNSRAISCSTTTGCIQKLAGNKYVRAAEAHASGYSRHTEILLALSQQNAPLLLLAAIQ